MMTHPSKRKGNSFEREVVKIAIESGLTSKRAYASNGESLGLHAEVDLMIGDKKIQAKRRKSLAAWTKPSEHVDAVVMREDHGDPVVIITLWEYLDLLKGAEQCLKTDGQM